MEGTCTDSRQELLPRNSTSLSTLARPLSSHLLPTALAPAASRPSTRSSRRPTSRPTSPHRLATVSVKLTAPSSRTLSTSVASRPRPSLSSPTRLGTSTNLCALESSACLGPPVPTTPSGSSRSSRALGGPTSSLVSTLTALRLTSTLHPAVSSPLGKFECSTSETDNAVVSTTPSLLARSTTFPSAPTTPRTSSSPGLFPARRLTSTAAPSTSTAPV
jgi:hypothetical protein